MLNRQHLKFAVAAFLLAGAIAISGCANFNARIAAAYDVHTAITRSVAEAVDSGLISADDAIAYREIAKDARMLLDAARYAHAVNAKDAEDKLRMAERVLGELQRYMIERERRRESN
jgi:hypothetical protein